MSHFRRWSKQVARRLLSNRLLEQRAYRRAIRLGIPYLGPHLAAADQGSFRYPLLEQLVAGECRSGRPLSILEIGSWAGGSAIAWARALKKYNNGLGQIICVDAWQTYLNLEVDNTDVNARMEHALKSGEIFRLFLHNIETSGCGALVRIVRGRSRDILPLLRIGIFDIIYIDASHAYEDVLADVSNCTTLLRDGGLLCGDDLELQLSEVDAENARRHAHVDYIRDPKTGREFHPGVTLAIGEVLGSVSACNGTWWVRKVGTTWRRDDADRPEALPHSVRAG